MLKNANNFKEINADDDYQHSNHALSRDASRGSLKTNSACGSRRIASSMRRWHALNHDWRGIVKLNHLNQPAR